VGTRIDICRKNEVGRWRFGVRVKVGEDSREGGRERMVGRGCVRERMVGKGCDWERM
jgi:hypothetical protein